MVVTVAVVFISVVSGVLWRFRSSGFALLARGPGMRSAVAVAI